MLCDTKVGHYPFWQAAVLAVLHVVALICLHSYQTVFHCLQNTQQRMSQVVLEVSVRGDETGIGVLGKNVVMTLRLRRQQVFQRILKF